MSSAALPAPAQVAHRVSPGLWVLAWRRLRTDRVAMVSLCIVALFLMMIVLSASGVIARDWAREVGVNYAPPTIVGPGAADVFNAPATPTDQAGGSAAPEFKSSVVDPLADDIAALKGGAVPGASAPAATDENKV